MTDLRAISKPAAEYTGEYTYLRGEYAIGPERLPYFSAAMAIADVNRHFLLAREVMFDVDKPANLEELFQRDIDVDRAEKEITSYLQQPESLKFFNSFTVVLLPVARGDYPTPLDSYPDGGDAAAPPPPDDGLEVLQVGPIKLRHMPDGRIGFISWNTSGVRAVVIDGQHRLYALRQLLADSAFVKQMRPETTMVPVLFLVLDPRAGYVPPAGGPVGVLGACRNVFVDLNKNAKRVEGARLALLNDRALADVAMRGLLTNDIGVTGGEPVDRAGRLPLALIDWHSDSAKFDTSLYLSSVLVLRDIVDTALGLREPPPFELEQWRAHLDALEARLEPTTGDGWDRSTMNRRLEDAESRELPFRLTDREIRAAAAGFGRGIGRLIVERLMRLRPYAVLLDAYREAELLDGKFELWLGHDAEGKAAYARMTGEEIPNAQQLSTRAKVEHPLAFQVVFQKGLLRSLQLFESDRRQAFAELSGTATDQDRSRQELIDTWVSRFDDRVTPFLDDYDFWRGAGVRLDGTIDFTRSSIPAIAGWTSLVLMAPLHAWKRAPRQTTDRDRLLNAIVRRQQVDDDGTVISIDRYGSGKEGVVFAASMWLMEQMDLVRPGKTSDPHAALTRPLVGPWRTQLRRYLAAEARTRAADLADYTDLAVAVHGGRRLAAVAESPRS